MRSLIVDDERLARQELRRLLGRHPEIEIVGEAASAQQARRVIGEKDLDLLFLDVQMPGETGFDLVTSLPSAPVVVFTTAYDEHALRAFEVSALDYLVKPIEPRRLARTVERVLAMARTVAAEIPDGHDLSPAAVETTADTVQRVLAEELSEGGPTLEHLAKRLHMSARTLHRRLAAEGTTFRSVVTKLRMELAERALREPHLPIGEIAFRLGFSEPSAFHRAFKRWTGWQPLAYRRVHAPSAAVTSQS
jgi:YesN/AraC family two-component response regulator